ncbi:HAD family hydrolase [Gloeothece verrucosa]|uniref:HAD-superfamily hydrolase, subfamily IA, variant 1 n=1 Tax=Gloeothece verrucosa (strain PCC 7822) TaxID=497965 RepID=E0UNM6_GLOV7|nr:HAD family hydrolase [Gloeothece verrucosa]ADN18556.1 HAD-superfamily hydrolase, subfamily IA, variant 1 [Gloeothece verrucosa PCC 7822]
MSIKGVLLDVDGTLVDSNDAHAKAWVEAFKKFAYDISFEEVRPLIGMGGDKVISQLVPGLTDSEGVGKEISSFRQQLIVNQYGKKLSPTPGARQLLLKMLSLGLKLIVASSAKNEELSVLLKSAGIEDLLPEATTSSDVDNSKPEPDIVQAARDKINLPQSQVIMLGDTPYDIEAASRAGVSIIALRCGGFSDSQLEGAVAIYDDPAQLLEQYETSETVCKENIKQSGAIFPELIVLTSNEP